MHVLASELMWIHGDEVVVNVVDVTILECLSDDRETRGKFGTYVTNDFRQYINNNVLTNNDKESDGLGAHNQKTDGDYSCA